MINRVQAFNNKNNCNQNFGMAVTGIGGEELLKMSEHVTRHWSSAERLQVRKLIDTITEQRQGDHYCNIVFSPNLKLKRISVILADLTGIRISGHRTSFSIADSHTPESIINDLCAINEEAIEHERGNGGSQSANILGGIRLRQEKK